MAFSSALIRPAAAWCGDLSGGPYQHPPKSAAATWAIRKPRGAGGGLDAYGLYTLFNWYIGQSLAYSPRQGIDLRWVSPNSASIVQFEREYGATGPLRYGERLSLFVAGGGYLVY